VHGSRIPPPAQHPHQRQMTTVLVMMLAFSAMALVLSAILVATSLAAMLARQVREIGVMKAIGARAGQIAGLYVVWVGLLGLASAALAVPAGLLGARAFSGAISKMLNFTIANEATPGWVFAVQIGAGILVPLLIAAIPIRRASHTTVRRALDDHGVSGDRLRARFASFPLPLRNALRKPARLALTLGLLSAGGSMFMTAFNVKGGWEANVAKVYETRSYDVEVQLQAPQPTAVAERLRQLPGVAAVEAWGLCPAAFARPDPIDVMRTYPDKGHGSLLVMAPPPSTKLIRFPLKAGRWLVPGDRDAVVLNHAALAQAPHLRIGSPVELSLDGQRSRWRLVGVVEEIGSAGVAYVTDEAFAQVTGTQGRARMLRIATNASSAEGRTAAIRTIERDLVDARVAVQSAIPLAELRSAVGDHILILIRSLVAMAVILAIVGTLGLASTMGVSVVERTRELGVMKTLGAAPGRIVRMLVSEGTTIGAMSFVWALLLSIPLTLLVDRLVGNLGFLAPLPFVLSPIAAAIWLGLVVIVSFAATLLPARQASALSIREALSRN
jgi:putative ABC transport system permease protein